MNNPNDESWKDLAFEATAAAVLNTQRLVYWRRLAFIGLANLACDVAVAIWKAFA